MGKKKHAEHVNHERWLVSYADLLTLLFAFFVVLFASSVSDKKKTAAMAAAMQTAFAEHGVFDAHAATPALEPGAGTSQGTPMPLMQTALDPPERAGKRSEAELKQQVQRALAKAVSEGTASVHESKDGLTISLSEAGFFGSGSAEVQAEMLPLLAKIAITLPNRDLRVEGHTDDVPIHTEHFRSNWDLSTARAAAIAEVLMARGRVAPAHFALAGYGAYRPVADNGTAQGRAQNRRVDIVLLTAEKVQTALPAWVAPQIAGDRAAAK